MVPMQSLCFRKKGVCFDHATKKAQNFISQVTADFGLNGYAQL